MSFKPYTNLIPSQIRWFKDLADFGKGGLVTLPGNEKKAYRAWADPSAVQYTRDFFSGFYEATSSSDRSYNVIARDSSGFPLLTPIGSPEYNYTYIESGDTHMPQNDKAYKQYSFMFTKGVPFLKKISLNPLDEKLDEPNFKGFNPGIDYPLYIKPTDMLVLVNSEVQTITVEDFLKLVSVRDIPYDKKLELVQNVLTRTDLSAKNKCAAINDITTIPNVVYPVV